MSISCSAFLIPFSHGSLKSFVISTVLIASSLMHVSVVLAYLIWMSLISYLFILNAYKQCIPLFCFFICRQMEGEKAALDWQQASPSSILSLFNRSSEIKHRDSDKSIKDCCNTPKKDWTKLLQLHRFNSKPLTQSGVWSFRQRLWVIASQGSIGQPNASLFFWPWWSCWWPQSFNFLLATKTPPPPSPKDKKNVCLL